MLKRQKKKVYGELCINVGLYGYAAAGVAKSWLAFGALLAFADADAAEAYAAAASAAGLRCRATQATITIDYIEILACPGLTLTNELGFGLT